MNDRSPSLALLASVQVPSERSGGESSIAPFLFRPADLRGRVGYPMHTRVWRALLTRHECQKVLMAGSDCGHHSQLARDVLDTNDSLLHVLMIISG